MADNLTERLESCYTGAVFDVMWDLGFPNGLLPRELKSLDPEKTVAGPVFPVLGRPDSSLTPDESLLRWTEFLGTVPAGHVDACQPQDDDRARMGELSAETLQFRVCGATSWTAAAAMFRSSRHSAFPSSAASPPLVTLWWRGLRKPTTSPSRLVRSIHPGDYILGDQDGIVILPGTQAEAIVNRVEVVVQTENLVRKAILEDMPPKEGDLQYRKF